MKTADQLNPNYAPVYAAAMYPDLAVIFHEHGYALAVHGSLARDFDLIAVPWAETVSDATVVVAEVTKKFAVRIVGNIEQRNHQRIAYTLSVGFGECAVDLSFFRRHDRPIPRNERTIAASGVDAGAFLADRL